tara:strand:- start:12537 stop:12917 length:381 start_codon:yes stop_codon:yes gene_type:complete
MDNNNDALYGSLKDVFVDTSTGQATETIVKTGKIKDGTEYGKNIILTDATTRDGKQIFYVYEKVGYLYASEGNKYILDGKITYNNIQHTTNGESVASITEKKVFGYDNEKDGEKWIGLSLLEPLKQ